MVMLQTVQRDLIRMKKNKALKHFLKSGEANAFVPSGWPQIVDKNVAFIQPSTLPTGT